MRTNINTHLVRLITAELKVPEFSLSDHILLLLLYSVQPIHAIIEKDEDTHKIQKVINQGMQDNAQNLQNYLLTWDNYREIWEIRKDAFIRRYQRLNPQVSSFDADIARCVLVWSFLGPSDFGVLSDKSAILLCDFNAFSRMQSTHEHLSINDMNMME